MTNILLSSSNDHGFVVVCIAVLALNIFLIVKFLELAKDVRNILFFLQEINRNLNNQRTTLQPTIFQDEQQLNTISADEIAKRVAGNWSCIGNVVYYIHADGKYERKKYGMPKNVAGFSLGNNKRIRTFDEKDVLEEERGSWHIENRNIIFIMEETNKGNKVKEIAFNIVDLGLTTMKFVNPLSHSEFRLNRIS